MFEKIKVKKTKKADIKGNRKESINCECPRSSDNILPVVKCKKKKIKLESTGEDPTEECGSNAITVPLPDSVEYSKKKLKKKKRKLEIEADDINIIVKSTIEQTLDRTNKISKKKSKVNPTDDGHIVNDKKGMVDEVAVNNEIPVDDAPSSLNVKAKRKKKKKKKSSGNEIIIDEHENKELDEFIGELDEESNAQYDNWVKQIDSIFKKSM